VLKVQTNVVQFFLSEGTCSIHLDSLKTFEGSLHAGFSQCWPDIPVSVGYQHA
jgi:hypothetical protein